MKGKQLYERLINVPRVDTAAATFHVLHNGQDFPAPVQLTSAAIYFLLLCEHYRLSPQEVFTIAKNLMNAHDGALATEFEAIRMYLKEEC